MKDLYKQLLIVQGWAIMKLNLNNQMLTKYKYFQTLMQKTFNTANSENLYKTWEFTFFIIIKQMKIGRLN